MALSIRDYPFIKAAHHQGYIRYGTSSGMQCSCMSLISVTLFRSPGIWDKFGHCLDLLVYGINLI